LTYTVKLKEFEGPFDLLLFFIHRDELDIHDIPIATMTNDFLQYIRQMESMNIDMASEFILVAATLMRIKAKMLLPRQPVNEDGTEIDPRQELVARLMEYKRYKGILEEMRQLEEASSKIHQRGNVTNEIQILANKALVDMELESLTLYNLMKAFYRLLEEKKSTVTPVHSIVRYPYTIEGQQKYVLSRLKKGIKTRFENVFEGLENRVHAIVTFLGILEMLNQQRLIITKGDGPNNFWLEATEESSTKSGA
jgi:segregation and condensation protein A